MFIKMSLTHTGEELCKNSATLNVSTQQQQETETKIQKIVTLWLLMTASVYILPLKAPSERATVF